MLSSTEPIVIIGGGLAAPALALALDSYNIPSVVYETRPADAVSLGNIALAPNGLRILDRLGVYEGIKRSGYNYDLITFVNAQFSVLGRFLNGSVEKYGYSALRVQRRVLRKALLDKLAERGIPIHYEKRCTGVAENESGVTVSFADGTSVIGDRVIGADGIHSTVRKAVVPDVKPLYSGLVGIGASLPREQILIPPGTPLPCFMFGRSGGFAFMPSNLEGSECGFFATVEVDGEGRTRTDWDAFQEDKESLKRRLIEKYQEGWHSGIINLVQHVDANSLVAWPQFRVPALSSYFSPSQRVILVGDAAHAIPPTGGQGASMAFEDVWTLAEALHKKKSITEWSKIRVQRLKAVAAFTDRSGSSRKAIPSPWLQPLKEMGMRLFFKWAGEDSASWMYSDVVGATRSS